MGKCETMVSKTPLDNEALARWICQNRELDGLRFAVGSFVALASGRVVGIGNSFDEADALLVAAGISPDEGMVCEVAELETDIVRCEPRAWL